MGPFYRDTAAQHALHQTAANDRERPLVNAGRWADKIPDDNEQVEWRRMQRMGIEELEAAALSLEPRARARLAGRLLESLDELTPEENDRLWAEEAERRSAALDAGSLTARSAEEVFRDARARI